MMSSKVVGPSASNASSFGPVKESVKTSRLPIAGAAIIDHFHPDTQPRVLAKPPPISAVLVVTHSQVTLHEKIPNSGVFSRAPPECGQIRPDPRCRRSGSNLRAGSAWIGILATAPREQMRQHLRPCCGYLKIGIA